MSSKEASYLELHGTQYPTGKHVAKIRVTTDLNGSDIVLVPHVIVGARPGPVLFVASTLHGGEWASIEAVRQIVARLEPERLSGSVIAVPVANPTALGQITRSTPDESDNADLNRVFPGPESWITEQLAATITREILSRATALIDFHYGSWGSTFGVISYGADFPDPKVASTSRDMAHAFGFPLVRGQTTQQFPGAKSMIGYAGMQGIPGIIGGVGGAGFEAAVEREWLEVNVEGVNNVMRSLGMLDEPVRKQRALEFKKMIRVNPTVGGFLYPEQHDESFGREVTEGEVLATVVSPYDFEVLETLRAPCDGYLMYYARWYPVRPGDWAFGVIQKGHTDTVWVDTDGSRTQA